MVNKRHELDCPCKICMDEISVIESRIKREKERKPCVPKFESLANCDFCGKPRETETVRRFSNTEDFAKYCLSCLQKSASFKSKYKITLDDYKSMLADQEGRCAICNRETLEGVRAPHVDHCHESEHVRGILCAQCNIGLGGFRDNVEVMKAAIMYLVKNKIKRMWWYQKVFAISEKNI